MNVKNRNKVIESKQPFLETDVLV